MYVLFIFIGLIGVILYLLLRKKVAFNDLAVEVEPIIIQQQLQQQPQPQQQQKVCIRKQCIKEPEFYVKRNKQKVCTQHTVCSPKNHCAKSQFGKVCTDRTLYNDTIYSRDKCYAKKVIIPSNLPTMTTMGLNTSITELTAAALDPATNEFVPTTISS